MIAYCRVFQSDATAVRSSPRASDPLGHTLRLTASILILATLAFLFTVHAQDVSDEYRLKAAFVHRFPQFVDWPASSLDGRNAVELCVLSPNPFGSVLQELVQGDSLSGLPFAVRAITSVSQATTCHVVFLPNGSGARRSALRQLAMRPVLTVSDAPRFLDEGGMVQLRLVDQRVRFEINAAAADSVGLKLSSQLLRLAVNVRGGPS